MNSMLNNIVSGVIANILFAIFLIFVGWVIYWLTSRRKLLNFFNIKESKRLVIYLSNLRIIEFGSIGIDEQSRSYAGPTVVVGELLAANRFKENFNYLIPKLSESPSLWSKILFADIKVTISPSVLNVSEIESQTTIITFGSPGYNLVSEHIETIEVSNVKFAHDNRGISVKNLPTIHDTKNGFIQRIVEEKRSYFYVAGLSERGTVGAATYLAKNWKDIYKKYSDKKSFIIMLRFPTDNLDNWTIDFEKEIR